MSRPRLVMLAALVAGALALGGCDRLEQLSPLKADASSVTVRLPPPRTARPGFVFDGRRNADPAPLR
jgi:hypothetical protein